MAIMNSGQLQKWLQHGHGAQPDLFEPSGQPCWQAAGLILVWRLISIPWGSSSLRSYIHWRVVARKQCCKKRRALCQQEPGCGDRVTRVGEQCEYWIAVFP